MPLRELPDKLHNNLVAVDREIVVMKLIDHPNIMRLYDVWETSTELYLILEYIQGGELFDYICNKGRLPTFEALGYFQQIIAAMDYCHRFNIAHRDLKPENILLDQDFNIKIADFGMAIWENNTNDKMLRTACGSPHYAAPEVLGGQAYNGAAADIWSCGIILYTLLSGKLPFQAPDDETLVTQVAIGKFDMPVDIDPRAQDLIWKMLNTDSGKRIPMSGILNHPFFVSKKPKVIDRIMPDLDYIARPIDSLAAIDPDIFANLRVLWHGTQDAEIIESLRNDQQNWTKGIYHLLVEYRTKHLENYGTEEAELAQNRLQRKKIKRAKAAASKRAQEARRSFSFSKDADIGPSPSSLPPRDGPPTPRRAKRNVTTPPSPSEGTIYNQYQTKGAVPAISYHSPSPPPTSPVSPIWDALSLPPLTAPEIHDDKIEAFFGQIANDLNTMQTRMGTPNSSNPRASPNLTHLMEVLRGQMLPWSDTTAPPVASIVLGQKATIHRRGDDLTDEKEDLLDPRSPRRDPRGLDILNNGTKPLTIRRKPRQTLITDTGVSDKENLDEEDYLMIDRTGNVMKKSSMRTGNRRAGLTEKTVQIVEPIDKERSKLKKKRSIGPASPAFLDAGSSFTPPSSPAASFSPKRNWFGNVFNFRPTSYTLLSTRDVQTTRNECRRLLMGMDVRVVLEGSEGLGVLKCRLDDVKDPCGVMSVLKAVKFRVEVHRLIVREGYEGHEVSLLLVQEKGATESFKEVFKRLRREWDLDIIGNGTPREVLPSPALTMGEGFAEMEPLDFFQI